jgi:hypothetical protein
MILKQLSIITMIFLTACGGSGDNSNNDNQLPKQTPDPQPEVPVELSTSEASSLISAEIELKLASFKTEFENDQISISEEHTSQGTYGSTVHLDAIDAAFDTSLITTLSEIEDFILNLYSDYDINGPVSEHKLNTLRANLDKYLEQQVLPDYEPTFDDEDIIVLSWQVGYTISSRVSYLLTSLKARGM